MKQYLIETWAKVDDFFLEAGRVMLIAALGILIEALISGNIDWNLVGGAMILAAIRALDRWLHEKGIAEKGITRF